MFPVDCCDKIFPRNYQTNLSSFIYSSIKLKKQQLSNCYLFELPRSAKHHGICEIGGFLQIKDLDTDDQHDTENNVISTRYILCIYIRFV